MHKMLRDLSDKLRAKFPATTHGYNAFLEVLLTGSKPSRGSKIRKGGKGKTKKILKKANGIGNFLVQTQSENF